MMKETMYAALTVDIINSRSYTPEERISIQKHVYNVIELLNASFKADIEMKFSFTSGDELQGLFRNTASAFLFCRLFMMLCLPVKVRSGIGIGTWDIRMENYGTSMQDGKAYHYARTAIDFVKKEKDVRPILCYSATDSDQIINEMAFSSLEKIANSNPSVWETMIAFQFISPLCKEGMGCLVPDCGREELFFDTMAAWQNSNLYLKVKSERRNVENSQDRFHFEASRNWANAFPVDIVQCNNFYVKDGKNSKASDMIGNMLGITRQGTAKRLLANHIIEERNRTIVLARFLDREEL